MLDRDTVGGIFKWINTHDPNVGKILISIAIKDWDGHKYINAKKIINIKKKKKVEKKCSNLQTHSKTISTMINEKSFNLQKLIKMKRHLKKSSIKNDNNHTS